MRPDRAPAFLAAVLLSALVLVLSAHGAERTVTVSVNRANVRSGPGTGYPVVTTFQQGTKLEVLEQAGDWYRIKLPREGNGWVYREVISLDGAADQTRAPSTGGGLFDSLKRGFTASRQEEMTAAAGARGLGEEGGAKAGVDEGAVRKMESLNVPAADIRRFARDGGITPEKLP